MHRSTLLRASELGRQVTSKSVGYYCVKSFILVHPLHSIASSLDIKFELMGSNVMGGRQESLVLIISVH